MSELLGATVGASSVLVALVLFGAGVSKARSSREFATQIAAYRIVPDAATILLARAVTAGEMGSAIALGVGLATASVPLRQIGALVATMLFALFLAALIRAYTSGREIACACFGGNSDLETVGAHSVVRTGLLLLLASLAIVPANTASVLRVVALSAVIAALVAVASEIMRLLGPLQSTTKTFADQLAAAPGAPDRGETQS